ncbi:MAG: hypothetical protein QXU18_05435 [Thermoplasmatales archaeon]
MNNDRLIASLKTLEHFTNDSLKLMHHSQYLSGFHFNRELLKAAVANTYLETVGERADSIHLYMEKHPLRHAIKNTRESLFSRILAISKKHLSENTDPIMIAFDCTHEDFYGDRDSLWIHGWTGDHGVTLDFSYLTASIVNTDLRLPLISIPSQWETICPQKYPE